MSSLNFNNQPPRGTQPDPRTKPHKHTQSVFPLSAVRHSAVPQSETPQSAPPQIQLEFPQSVTPKSAPPPIQSTAPQLVSSQSDPPQIQSEAPQSVTPQSEALQPVFPQSEPPQTVSHQSAFSQTQSHSVNPQYQSVYPQSVQELSEAAKHAIDPTASLTDVVARSGRNLVARKNLRRLLNRQETKEMWLDDEVFNCYFGHLMARANANRDLPKIYCFTSHFFESACPDLWARKEKLFDMDVILIPVIVIKSHWVLVSVFPSKKTIIFYDSMYGCGFEVLMKILQIFENRCQKETACPHRR